MEVLLAIVLVILGALGAFFLVVRNALIILVAEVKDGVVRVKRGGVAPRVLADLADVVARPPVRAATLRIERSNGRAVLAARGDLSDAQLQQLRNVIGTVPRAMLVNTRRRR
ncbi:MAG TPA: DUF3634 family protein [Polyangiaceae bacterium]|jgi:hypothetical protein